MGTPMQSGDDEGHAARVACVTGSLVRTSWATGWRMRQLKPRSPRTNAADPVQVLDGEGAVEPEFGADLGEDLRVAAFLAGEDDGGIAGHELLEGEDEDADQEDRWG